MIIRHVWDHRPTVSSPDGKQCRYLPFVTSGVAAEAVSSNGQVAGLSDQDVLFAVLRGKNIPNFNRQVQSVSSSGPSYISSR